MSSVEQGDNHFTLTNLPLSLQTRILSYLCPHHPFRDRINRFQAPYRLPFRDPPVKISLDCAQTLTIPLPHQLLPPALASPILATAVANLLGNRVSFLTNCNTNGELSAWVEAFAPYVKAVSAHDPFPQWWLDDLCLSKDKWWFETFETQIQYSVQLFKTLSIDAVKLEVLDLLDVHFLNLNSAEDQLMAGLYATLEANSDTLRELALPVFRTSDVCDKALEMSTLKKLDVLTVKLWSVYVVDHSGRLAPPFLRMLRAVNGHADRSRKLSTLRELRFLDFHTLGYQFVTNEDRNSSVFHSVKTLRVARYTNKEIQDENHQFILLFKNLESLFWNIWPERSDMLFRKVCARVPNIHLCGARWFTNHVQVGADKQYEGACPLFDSESRDSITFELGAIRSVFGGLLFRDDLQIMIKYCPNLENLSVQVSQMTCWTLRKLIDKCQQLKCLELVVHHKRRGGWPDEEGWHKISRVVPKSHKNLCQVAIQPLGRYVSAMRYLEAAFRCFETVAKALGERARRLAFRIIFRTRRGVKIIERMTGLINTCIQHTRKLESLEMKVKVSYRDESNYYGDSEKEVLRRFGIAENRLIREVESLRTVDLSGTPWMWKSIDWNDGMLEMDRKSNEKESNCDATNETHSEQT